MENNYSKFFCGICGKWLGIKSLNANTEGVLPYCDRCKDNVKISDKQILVPKCRFK